jgi:hypothetical protein
MATEIVFALAKFPADLAKKFSPKELVSQRQRKMVEKTSSDHN